MDVRGPLGASKPGPDQRGVVASEGLGRGGGTVLEWRGEAAGARGLCLASSRIQVGNHHLQEMWSIREEKEM